MATIESDASAYARPPRTEDTRPTPVEERDKLIDTLCDELDAAAREGQIAEGELGRAHGRGMAAIHFGDRVHRIGHLRDVVETLTMLVRLRAMAEAQYRSETGDNWGGGPLHGTITVEIARTKERLVLALGVTI